jgi:hypothetical protein
LKESGIKKVGISLMAGNPKQFNEIMKPTVKEGFSDVCNFVVACVEAGKLPW